MGQQEEVLTFVSVTELKDWLDRVSEALPDVSDCDIRVTFTVNEVRAKWDNETFSLLDRK